MTVDLSATRTAIQAFGKADLASAGRDLLGILGYRSAKTIALDGSPATFAREVDPEGRLQRPDAKFESWHEVQFLFQLTNDEIPMLGREQSSFAMEERFGRSIVDSFVFLAISLDGEDWNRGGLAGITRAVNVLFPMPVIILFRHSDKLSIAVSERRASKRDLNRDVQTGRISIILGISTTRPHRGHLSILRKLEIGQMSKRPSNFDELYKGWLAALSTKTLNESFYRELSHWFFWAKTKVTFPEGAGDKPEVPLIRLLTRVIFCWFIKERGLIPETLFRLEAVSDLLKADPASHPEDGNYYRAILQNLFFATLNTEMGEGRKWRSKNNSGGQDGHHMIHSLYRYQDHFADADAALELFRQVPFLNGGLFECLDRELTDRDIARNPNLLKISDGKRLRIDGFSDHAKNALHVPNRIFFGEAVSAPELNKEFDTKGKAYSAKGLFTLFDDYVFTVEENTSAEEEVALDPELLGKVFENLLASVNEDTGKTVRSAKGAFYTPREVVQFMVDEALITYLGQALDSALEKEKSPPLALNLNRPDELSIELPTVQKAAPGNHDRVRTLVKTGTHNFSPQDVDFLIEAIEKLKAIDPACGSGAFLMGLLQQLVALLNHLDPENYKWWQRNRAAFASHLEQAKSIPDLNHRKEQISYAEAALKKLDGDFSSAHYADFSRKLYLIEKCLYGVDKEPIATQIAKLRFFISLAVSQRPSDDVTDNLGVTPLPNLETKIVAANTLIPLYNFGEMPLRSDEVRQIEKEMRLASEALFMARRLKRKIEIRGQIIGLRERLGDLLSASPGINPAASKKLVEWDQFDQSSHAPFFDAEWMFALSYNGNNRPFDIVLANPPYIKAGDIPADEKPILRAAYGSFFSGSSDYFTYFFKQATELLKEGGVMCFITSNKFLKADYGLASRRLIRSNYELSALVDFGELPVFGASVDSMIVIGAKKSTGSDRPFKAIMVEDAVDIPHVDRLVANVKADFRRADLDDESWNFFPPHYRQMAERISKGRRTLAAFVGDEFYRGILTGLNDAFILPDMALADALAKEEQSSRFLHPWLDGNEIKRWGTAYSGQYVIAIPSSANAPEGRWPWSGLNEDDAEKVFSARHPKLWAALSPHRDKAKKRTDKGDYWWELRACSYWHAFEKPKLLYNETSKKLNACVDDKRLYVNKTGFLMLHDDPHFLAGMLNSYPLDFYYRMKFPAYGHPFQGGRVQFRRNMMLKAPIANADETQRAMVSLLAQAIASTFQPKTGANPALEQLLNGLVYELYFPDDLRARGLHLFDAAHKAGLDRLSGLNGDTLANAANAFTTENLAPGQPLRIMLSDLQTLDVVRIIEGKA